MAFPEAWLVDAINSTGAKGFPLLVPEQLEPPFVVYQRTGTEREYDLEGPTTPAVATFDLMVYADTYLDVKEWANRVRLAVHNFTGLANDVNIQWTAITGETDDDPVDFAGEGKPTYVVNLTLEVSYEE